MVIRNFDPTREAWGDDPPPPCACGQLYTEADCVTCKQSLCSDHVRRCDACDAALCSAHARPVDELFYCRRCHTKAVVNALEAQDAEKDARVAVHAGDPSVCFPAGLRLVKAEKALGVR